MKKRKVYCHCGAYAVLRPASYVHGKDCYAEYLYVCSKYPICDSYVGVHKRNKRALGTLADKELRIKRIKAHQHFNLLWSSGLMKKWQAYKWLQAKFGLNYEQAHIAKFSFYLCDQLIEAVKQVLNNNNLSDKIEETKHKNRTY